jgi:hypothetical protein
VAGENPASAGKLDCWRIYCPRIQKLGKHICFGVEQRFQRCVKVFGVEQRFQRCVKVPFYSWL